MANTVEYAILLLAGFYSNGRQVSRISITKDQFILYDVQDVEIDKAKRIGGDVAVVSDYFSGLSFGTVLRYLVSDRKLFAVSDEEGEIPIECEVTEVGGEED